LLTVHKVATQPDTSLTATPLNPDANWTGVQTTDKVALFARGGLTRPSPTTFTTTHGGTAQYLIAGLAAGTYQVTVGGNAVLGATTVSDGDNTLYFESTAGAVVISISAGAQACSISTTAVPAGAAGTAYSTTFQTANCSAPVSWSVTAGTLCIGLALDSGTGILSGTPSTPQNCSFTVQASDSGGNTAIRALAQAVSAIGSVISSAATTSVAIRH
jgi:hypothetical protein